MSPAKLSLVEDLKSQWERASAHRPDTAEAEAAVRMLIAYAGDDPAREGLVDTPSRVIRSFDEFFAGYLDDPVEILVIWN